MNNSNVLSRIMKGLRPSTAQTLTFVRIFKHLTNDPRQYLLFVFSGKPHV